MKNRTFGEIPTILQLERELGRIRYRSRFRSMIGSTIGTLAFVAAIAVLVATLWLPVLKIYGSSMTPALWDGDLIVASKTSEFAQGDIIAFYFNNKILVKRIICKAGDWIHMEEDGTVYINGTLLEEPYLTAKALGDCNIEFPYQVPDGKVFVMGDHRSISVDSRNTALGCVAQEQIVGKVVFRIWPFERLGQVE